MVARLNGSPNSISSLFAHFSQPNATPSCRTLRASALVSGVRGPLTLPEAILGEAYM